MTQQMTRRTFVKTAVLGASALTAPVSFLAPSVTLRASSTARPNILLLQSDQHTPGAMSCAGHPTVHTPNMDALAATGVHFPRAICPSPVCEASRVSTLTGYYPHQTGFVKNSFSGMDTRWQWTFPRALQRSGYHTALMGIAHMGVDCRDLTDFSGPEAQTRIGLLGFDTVLVMQGKAAAGTSGKDCPYTHYLKDKGLYEAFRADMLARRELPAWYCSPSVLDEEDYQDIWLANEVVRWLDDYNEPLPFFLWVNWRNPHHPWDAPGTFYTLYDPALIDMPYPDPRTGYPGMYGTPSVDWPEEGIRGVRSNYYGMVNVIDHCIGRIVQTLQDNGMLDNTMIVYLSDHGEMLGDHGLFYKKRMFQQAVGVPLIVSYPQAFDQNRSVQLPVSLIDLAPTILETAQVDVGTHVQGKSLVPLLTGNNDSHNEALFSRYQGDMMVMTDRYKYIWNRGWGSRALLFDCQADPLELQDLSDLPEYATVREELHTMWLDRGLKSTAAGAWHVPDTWDQNRVPGESHDVCIGSGTTVTVDADARCRSLTVEHGATLILPSGVRLTAEQFVINIGTLQQMQLVDSADVPFLEIQNASGTGTLFRGANIASSHNLGEVTVAIHGLTAGEDCTDPSQAPPDSVRRCYNITSASSTAAMIRLWALTYELDGIAQNALSVYHLSDLAMWEPLTANWAVGNDGGSYAFAEGEAIGFSAFLLGLKEDAPTAIVLRCLDTRSGRSMGLGLLLAPPLLLGLGTLWALRRRLDSGQAEG